MLVRMSRSRSSAREGRGGEGRGVSAGVPAVGPSAANCRLSAASLPPLCRLSAASLLRLASDALEVECEQLLVHGAPLLQLGELGLLACLRGTGQRSAAGEGRERGQREEEAAWQGRGPISRLSAVCRERRPPATAAVPPLAPP